MGKRKNAKRKGKNHNKEDDWNKKPRVEGEGEKKDNGLWLDEKDKTNQMLIDYYKQIIPEQEFEQFIAILKLPLPTAFRITANNPFTATVKAKILKFANDIAKLPLNQPEQKTEGAKKEGEVAEQSEKKVEPSTGEEQKREEELPEKIEPPTIVPWYPASLAWVFDVPRKVLRKTAVLKSLHEFLIQQNEVGGISRQEVVSMLPAFFLEPQADHLVLDMCAAPGSKTAQLLEFIHTNTNPEHPPTGIVMANDVDEKRCYLLVHQTKRLSSPCYVITNHEAQLFPLIRNEKKEVILFDRILCDVPCSGDGTLRKNVDLWSKWNPHLGNGLHSIQYRIAMKGAKLLKVGGRLVYSTCSMNPVEDEAVVSNILRTCEGALELVDVSDMFPSLKRRPGITHWKVMDKSGEWYETHENVPYRRKKRITPSFFPPTAEEVKAFNLHRCMRIYPHFQNTGGFFVAVFSKTALVPTVKKNTTATTATTTAEVKEKNETEAKPEPTVNLEEEEEEEPLAPEGDDEDEDENPVENKEKKSDEKKTEEKAVAKAQESEESTSKMSVEGEEGKKDGEPTAPAPEWMKKAKLEAPFIAVRESDPALAHIKKYYGIKDEFPFGQLLGRSENYQKMYFISAGVKALLLADKQDRLKVVNTGLRLFEKHTARGTDCEWRICQDGVACIAPFVTRQLVRVSQNDLALLVCGSEVAITSFSEEAQKSFGQTDSGCVVIVVDSAEFTMEKRPFVFVGWKGTSNCHLLVNRKELNALKPFFS